MKPNITLFTILAAGLLASRIVPAAPAGARTQADLDAKIAQLSTPGTTVSNVICTLGPPNKYVWNHRTLDKARLPETYIMVYTNGVHVMITAGLVDELRSEEPGPFTWHGKLRRGSSLDEVLRVLGPPSRTVVGQPLKFVPGVLYKDIDGMSGRCYYHRSDHHIRLFFLNYKVNQLYLPVSKKMNEPNVSGDSL